jgi:hypothetical protein
MIIKKILIALIFALCLSSLKIKAQTVYISESGKKYHAKNCDIAKTGKKGIELTEAKRQGFIACKICKIDQPKKIADKPKDKNTTRKTK